MVPSARRALGAAACVLLLAAPASAKEPPAAPPAAWDAMPTPSPKDCDARFARYDGDRDGKVTYREYGRGRWGELRFIRAPSEEEARRHVAMYEASARGMDTNHDGSLSLLEHRASCQRDLTP